MLTIILDLIFGIFAVLMFLHVFFLFPETAGKTLEDVRYIFEDPNGVPGIGTPAWRTKGAYHNIVKYERGDPSVNQKGSITHVESISGSDSEKV